MAPRRWLALLFVASGAAALIYEITWTRQLTLVLGHSVAAASTVLAAMMGGLGLGAWLAGRFLAARAGPRDSSLALRAYACMEVVAAIAAIALPWLLKIAAPILGAAYGEQGTLAFAVARTAIAALLVGVPAAAMGATFPFIVSAAAETAADAGRLYALNTAGAALGAFATGFFLIPAFGLFGTTAVGVALNVFAGGAAWRLASRDAEAALKGPPYTPPHKLSTAAAPKGPPYKPSPPYKRLVGKFEPMPRLAMAAAALSGCCGLMYEVIWTRLVALIIGPTTYAFATVVAAFVIGLAIGAMAGARIVQRVTQPAVWLGATLMAAAVGATVAGWVAATRLPLVVAAQVAAANATIAPVLALQVIGTTLLLLPLTFALGAAFPLAIAMATGRSQSPQRLLEREPIAIDAAHVYTANTIGAIGGALAGGFVLLPAFGLQASLQVVAGLGIAGAAAIWLIAGRPAPRIRTADRLRLIGAITGVVLVVLVPAWNPALLAGGVYKYAPYIALADLETELGAWRQLYLEDGAAATVAVRELAGQRSLVIDGKVDASNAGDMLTQRLLGVLPVLLHGRPQRILVLGLGSGVTAASTLAPGVDRRVDVVEISPEVVEASDFFARENGGIRQAAGVQVITGDGRSHLAFTSHKYDVIISEPSNPWMAGIAALFTREFFETARRRLTADGIICQWAHTYDISADDLKSIVGTFTAVFPDATMWLVGDGDLLLIGSTGTPMEARLSALVDRAAVPGQALADVGIAQDRLPFLLTSMLAGNAADMQQYAAGATVQTDARMALEFSAPRAIYGRATRDNAAEIRQLSARGPASPAAQRIWNAATAADWAAAGAMSIKADAYAAAYDAFMRAVTLDSADATALGGMVDAATGLQRQADALAWLERTAAAEPGNANVRIEWSRALAASGDLERAATIAAVATRLAPESARAAEQLAAVLADAGDGRRLAPFAEAMASRFPASTKADLFRARAYLLNGDASRAVAIARQVVARQPGDVRAQNVLGAACATAGDRGCAGAAFEAAMRAAPRDAETYVNLGVLRLQSGDPAEAARHFAVAATIDRHSVAARQGLAEARVALSSR